MMLDWIGWLATGLFAVSYLFKRTAALRGIQALAASVWIGYGIVINARPVIVANLVVVVMATYSLWRDRLRAAPTLSGSRRQGTDAPSTAGTRGESISPAP